MRDYSFEQEQRDEADYETYVGYGTTWEEVKAARDSMKPGESMQDALTRVKAPILPTRRRSRKPKVEPKTQS